MTVRANKPAFSIREKLKELQKPIGLKGSELMRAETVQDARDLVGAGRKNLLINGRMQVWQRATSHTTASGYRSVDRWSFNTYTSGAFTVSKGTDTVHGEYLSWNRTTADTNNPNAGNCLQQAIEDCAYLVKGKYITLSFWLKNEKTILRSGFARLRLNASPYTALGGQQTWTSTTNEWEYHTITWQIPESIATTHLELQIQLDNGSSMGDIKITKVQLEVGKNATEFEHRSYGEELALCQRYYQILEIPGNAYGAQYGTVGSGVFAGLPLTFITKMRTAPTSVTYEHISGTEYWVQVSTTAFSGTGGAGRTFASTDSSVKIQQTRVSGNNTPSGSSYYVWEASFKLLLSSEL